MEGGVHGKELTRIMSFAYVQWRNLPWGIVFSSLMDHFLKLFASFRIPHFFAEIFPPSSILKWANGEVFLVLQHFRQSRSVFLVHFIPKQVPFNTKLPYSIRFPISYL